VCFVNAGDSMRAGGWLHAVAAGSLAAAAAAAITHHRNIEYRSWKFRR